ncbi:glycosyltransferase family 87 protein [Pseudonocardia xinjiangensis]|uniref:glycosyltransferase family 87 protein n=1 Tax=Pseudonocardia xinjiangensis TaxID=75289 RepID=UPI003D91BF87
MTRTAVGSVGTDRSRAALPTGPRAGRAMLVVIVLLTGLVLVLGYVNKARCTGPEFDAAGRSQPDYDLRIDRDVCYSDIQHLWLGRDIDHHVFPYLTGSITPDGRLLGGTVEYPVLTGLLMWAGALFAHNDAEFLLDSALLMAPFGLLTGWLLGRLARWRALVWALGPPLVLYAFHNWDLPVVACAVGAVFAVHGWRTDRPLAQRGVVAAVLLGLGFAFKLYPGAFVLPLALYVLTASRPGMLHWGAAIRVALAAAATVVLVNLPFALAGYQGWRASFTFQELRKVDLTTNSIWYWGFRPESDPDNVAFQSTMDWLSPGLVLLSFAVAAAVGWWRWRRDGVYPWVAVSGAMLCGFLLLHKVHSPQYTLWLVPFFVLLQVPWRWVVGYLVVDLVMGIGIFRWFYALKTGVGVGIYEGFAAQAVAIGVWGRAALLLVLFVVFLCLPDRLAAAGANRRTPLAESV